ncbi:MAG: four helix bundle protein [Candidatus Buchananbacteria bacterium CG10_big_fil_rev_8_21_14_0_10_42_9]|uniref:Four helix bundle protein n=1 Tax=Candidatus Buchananbacteria bacterium CG10_big_fil_rev_8_21_14_0_10_42_9 TaxID=1974526 RepID=A0A2H0W1V4_9BACT|nr:MAG: four helix bundle protein [Candidatus Buchananbacteria bacterium CG10_big_fil_rev_8_21_14_0_10_42_9]
MVEAYKSWHGFLPDFPRLYRYTLGTKIDTIFTEILELTLLAKYSDKNSKALLISKAIAKLDSLKFFLQVAWEIKALDNKKFTQLSQPLLEIGRMLGGWRKQLQK